MDVDWQTKLSNGLPIQNKMPIQRTLVIIAGGKSSRMQRDKALLPFGGYSTLSEYQYQRFKPFFSNIYLSTKENKFNFPCSIISDKYKDSSPLVALISIFETLDVDEVFILSVDSPFIPIEVCEKLYSISKDEDSIIVAKSNFGLEPLCGIYKRSILSIAKDRLNENRHRLQSLLSEVNTKEVYFENEELFMNLNHPHEYEDAKLKLLS